MGEIIITIAILLVSILLSGAVFTVLWEWFVVPIGVRSVSLWQSVGLMSLASVIMGS